MIISGLDDIEEWPLVSLSETTHESPEGTFIGRVVDTFRQQGIHVQVKMNVDSPVLGTWQVSQIAANPYDQPIGGFKSADCTAA